MAIVKHICRAIFVLPLTAGNLKWKTRQQFSHDGSISGLIMLTTLVTIVAEMIYIFKSDEYKKEHLSKPFLIAVNLLGILTCITVGVREKSRSKLSPRTKTINLALKLKFLYLFCIGCLMYHILKLVIQIKCKNLMQERTGFVVKEIVRDSLPVLFYLVQAWFVRYFARRQFQSSLFIFYSFVIISVANISNWTHHEAVEHDETRTSYGICFYNISNYAEKILLENIKPFIEPTLLEYPLLCIIFVSEMWPNLEQSNQNITDDQLLDGTVLLKHDIWRNEIENDPSKIFPHNMRNIDDYPDLNRISENMPLDPQLHRNSNGQARNLRPFCVLIGSALFSSPLVIIELLQMVGILNAYLILSSVVTAIEYMVMVIAIIICFYAMESQCQPCQRHNSYDIGSILLVISFLVSTCVYALHFLMYILPDYHRSNDPIIPIIKGLATIFELYFQTVYILQMKRYRILFQRHSPFSVRYICLFLACTNFSFWLSETLFAHYIYKFQDPYFVRIKTFNRIAFPFVIFYRFESFMSFYSLYKE